MALESVVFRYKPIGGHPCPMVTVAVKIAAEWRKLDLYVDYGAAFSVIHAIVAAALGFDWRSGRSVFIQVGGGSYLPVFLHKLPLQIGPYASETTIAFTERLGIPFHLLGRLDIFDKFNICFREREGVVVFEPVGVKIA